MLPILLLEDDKSLGYILSEYLEMQNLKTVWVKSAEEALQLIEKQEFSIAILDIMLPGLNGFEFAKILKSKLPALPFLFVSAKSLKIDKLKGYKLGAFDYLTKPIDEELLVAKINVLTKGSGKDYAVQEKWTVGIYTFAPNEQTLTNGSKHIKLTNKESTLLLLLLQHKNRLMPRKLALQLIWGSVDEFSRKSMDVFISHLRKYLSKDDNIKIENVHGKGFIFNCK